MSAGVWNPKMKCGTTFRRVVTLTMGSPPVPFVLNGYQARMALRKARAPNARTVLDLNDSAVTEGGSGLTIDGDNGQITILITDEDSWTLNGTKTAAHDLLVEAPDGTVWDILGGTFTLETGVTGPP